ncbi:MAG TPA: hypothetical protein VNP92_29165 [Actinophytocola sp.]|nr:hypothetical protein [Actinophytocola sp.]
MSLTRGSEQWRERSARELVERLRLRATLSEGVGILRTWRRCEQQQARDDLYAEHGGAGQDAEARRVIAVVDAAADGQADPEATWA